MRWCSREQLLDFCQLATDSPQLFFAIDSNHRVEEAFPGISQWLSRKDDPSIWTFEFEVIGVDGDLAVIRGLTTYTAPPGPGIYENLWLVRLDGAGRATSFTEYWMQRPA